MSAISSDKLQKLKAFLGQLPERMARQLLTAVELDRVSGGRELPHEVLLDGLRPKVVNAADSVRRTPTPMRLFCDPFEDLLVVTRSQGKRRAEIARSTLMPLWDWLAGDLMPALHREQCTKLTEAILQSDTAQIQEVAAEFQTAGAAAIERALESAGEGTARRGDMIAKLGDEAALADAEEIALVLKAAPAITEMQQVMHKPVPQITNDLAQYLRKIYDKVAEIAPDALPYVVAVMMHRLERPWEVLRLRAVFNRRHDDMSHITPPFEIAVEQLFDDLEEMAGRISSLDPKGFDPDAAMEVFGNFGRLLRGLLDEMESIHDAKLSERVNNACTIASEKLEAMFERAPQQIRDAMPFQAAGTYAARSSRRPDLARQPDEKAMDRASRLANFMRDSRPVANLVGEADRHAYAYDEILDGLNSYREGLLGEMRTSSSPEAVRNARGYLDLSVELTAILVSEGEANILRRKASDVSRGEQAAAH